MRKLCLGTVAIVAALLVSVSTVRGQAPPAATAAGPPPAYVASVKRARGGFGVRMMMQPGAINAENVPVRELIRFGYQMQPFQITGGPEWLEHDHFDVSAKLEGPPSPAQMQAMMRALLADRFKLVVRTEAREMPIYALLPARADGKPGPQLQPSMLDCVQLAAARGRGAPPPPPAPGQRSCGGRSGPGTLTAGGVALAQLVNQLSLMVNRMVIDRTGLTGAFDIDLKWTPSADQLPPGLGPAEAGRTFDPNGPSLFTALQEQLGLKLEAQRGPVDMLVIERIEQPTKN